MSRKVGYIHPLWCLHTGTVLAYRYSIGINRYGVPTLLHPWTEPGCEDRVKPVLTS